MSRALTAVLLPTVLLAAPLAAQEKDLVATAKAAGQFATLLAAVDAAGLTGTLQGMGPYTVFAPTDEAFRKLPPGTVESLLEPGNRERLKALLLYHVVPGRVPAATARTLASATTAEGRRVRIRTEGSALRIDDATVIMADVGARNGVIHVIDAVLMPPPETGAVAARELVTLAIARGAPLYNDGQPGATAAIYEVAARGLLALGDDVAPAARRRLERGLREAARTHDADERAWVLRRMLDEAAHALDGRMAMRSLTN